MDYASSKTTVMPLDLLREITNDFSEERRIGSGSYGKVYLGVHQNGKRIAVKILYDMPGIDDEQFQNEFNNLTRLRHQNIVRLVGYCHNIQEVQVEYKDECDRYDWQTGYGIIKGICQGLKYLHNELKPPIYHLDLKPANVLLDENMVPRIADFGMSRLFRDEKTRATNSSFGTIGYLPPEYICNNLISSKFDIFSLGVVIIKIMAGRAGYFNSANMSSQEFSNVVQLIWTNRLLETSNLRKAYSEQVKICIEIGLSCVQEDRHKRPTIQDIIDKLTATETECTYASRIDLSLMCQIIKDDDLEELRELSSIDYKIVCHGKWRGSDVAIKRTYQQERCSSDRLRNEFWNEVSNHAGLHHPNVVAFYGIVLDGHGGSIAIVTEYMVNGSLRTALWKNSKSLGRHKRLIIAMDAAFGMEYLHNKNIVHFDLKSDNLHVNLTDPRRPICKVGDLGLSKVKCQTLISCGVSGMLPWMAPELLNETTSLVSEKVDVYSFGIVLWEILTGEEPYAGLHYGAILGGIVMNTLRPPVPDSCDPEWRSLMEQCWAAEPLQRPSFTQIAARLRSMAAAKKAQPYGD